MRDKYLAFGEPDYTEREIEAVARVMRSGWVGMGPETQAFEQELSEYLNVSNIVTVNSCTSALFLSLLIQGVQPGDEVIVPSLTWCSDANVVLQLGAKPVFCDIDAKSLCVTSQSIAAKVTEKTCAVIVVHYGGYAVDVAKLRENLPPEVAIIEDAAHAFGACYPNGKKVGNSNNIVCFSFYANKNLSAVEGGAIALKDERQAERLRTLRMNGLSSHAWSRYSNPETITAGGICEPGYKMNFTDLQAAIGRVQLTRFNEMVKERLRLVERYRIKFDEFALNVRFQEGVFESAHARHLLVAFFDERVTGIKRNDLLVHLRRMNIGVSIHYEPLHSMPFFQKGSKSHLEVVDEVGSQILTLPLSAKMTDADVDYVVGQINQVVKRLNESQLIV